MTIDILHNGVVETRYYNLSNATHKKELLFLLHKIATEELEFNEIAITK